MRRSEDSRRRCLHNFFTFMVLLLLMVGVIVIKCYAVYMSWKMIANPDVGFWEYFWLTLFFR